MRVAVVGLLFGCIHPYQPGSFASAEGTFTGERVTIGCLELGISRRVESVSPAIVAYEFGNRCDRAAVVDLAHVRVRGRYLHDDVERTLEPYDPRGELVPLRLPARHTGREAIAYSASGRLARICVDAASLAGERGERWVCLAEEALL